MGWDREGTLEHGYSSKGKEQAGKRGRQQIQAQSTKAPRDTWPKERALCSLLWVLLQRLGIWVGWGIGVSVQGSRN